MAGKRGWKYRVAQRGSAAVVALEGAWDMLRKVEPAIPRAVLTLVDVTSRRRLRGYAARWTWRKRAGAAHEVALSPELIGHPKELLATMLHEAAHAVLFDAGQNGGLGASVYYHTTVFRDQCQILGLACAFRNTRYGWTDTSWPKSGVPERYQQIVDYLRRELPAGTGGRRPRLPRGRRLPPSGHTKLCCACDGRSVYVNKSMFESGGVVCLFCGMEFALPARSASR